MVKLMEHIYFNQLFESALCVRICASIASGVVSGFVAITGWMTAPDDRQSSVAIP